MSGSHVAGPEGRPPRGLGITRAATIAAIVFERFWRLALPLLISLSIFAILAWFGLFRLMPEWLRLGTLGLFALAIVGSLVPLSRFRWPERPEIDHRIEAENRLEHEPLAAQSDRLAGSGDPFAEALWREHRRRMADRLHDLEPSLPHTSVPRHDPWALRAVVVLLLVVGFAFSGGPLGGRLGDAFVPRGSGTSIPARVDAWVTPPGYTGRPPVFLTAEANSGDTAFTVPGGSKLTVHMIGGSGEERLQQTNLDGDVIAIEPTKTGEAQTASASAQEQRSVDFEYALERDGSIELHDAGRLLGRWAFTVLPDHPPTIAFTADPTYALNGTLELAYRAEDDYGITGARAEIVPIEKTGPGTHPLYEAPKAPLVLPRRGGDSQAKTQIDLTSHPWAGSEVHITLVATDAAGQEARSETKTIVLPQRPFSNPLARAVIEQRRILALDANRKQRVLDLLDAVTLRPEDTIKNAAHYLALKSARTRLALAQSDDELRNVVDYMWTIARGIEDGNLSAAEQRLRQAQEALRQALENGASDKEVERLTQELRNAMKDFLREFAERAKNNPSMAQTMPQMNGRELRQSDLDRMLDQIENLAKQGARGEAEQLLSQLQNMFNNLRMGRNGQGGQQNQAQQQMNQLGDLMRRQQEMMNRTFQLGRQGQQQDQQGQNGSQQGQGMTPEQLQQALRELQQGQGQLRSDLEKLMEGLKGLGMQPGREFGEAGQAMGRAGDALGQGEGGNAVSEQGNALDALRRGAQGMMQQMQQAMGNQNGQGQRQGEMLDPLGRPRSTTGPDFGNSVKVPDQIDIQRAREILDAIRRRLGNAMSPQMEKDYLERLLNFDGN